MKPNMRKEWFGWVAKTRKKLQRGNKDPVTHRASMKAAALTWGKEKLKILNRVKREERKRIKESQQSHSAPPQSAQKKEPTQ